MYKTTSQTLHCINLEEKLFHVVFFISKRFGQSMYVVNRSSIYVFVPT